MSFVKKLLTPQILTNAVSAAMCRQICTSSRVDQKSNSNKSEGEQPKLVTLLNRERSLNSVVLIGRVGTDPTTREKEVLVKPRKEGDETKEVHKVSTFSLATQEFSGLDANGESKFRVDWHRIVVVSDRAQTLVNKYIRKGDRIHVTGRLHYNMGRDKNGEPKLITSIVADDFIFLTKNVDPEV